MREASASGLRETGGGRRRDRLGGAGGAEIGFVLESAEIWSLTALLCAER